MKVKDLLGELAIMTKESHLCMLMDQSQQFDFTESFNVKVLITTMFIYFYVYVSSGTIRQHMMGCLICILEQMIYTCWV